MYSFFARTKNYLQLSTEWNEREREREKKREREMERWREREREREKETNDAEMKKRILKNL